MVVREQDVLLPNGLRLHVVESGAADGVPVLLLHGYTDSSHAFLFVLQKPVSGFRFIAPDLRGHGGSTLLDGPMTVEAFADDVLFLMGALQIPKAILVGHSMGALIAQYLAAEKPERVLGVALVGSAASAIGNPFLLDIQKNVEVLTDPVDQNFVREFQATDIPLPQSFLDEQLNISFKIPASVWKRALVGILETDQTEILSKIKCPAAIFWGRKDLVFDGVQQDFLRKKIVGATFQTFDGGHAFHWEKPEAFNRELERFLVAVLTTRSENALP